MNVLQPLWFKNVTSAILLDTSSTKQTTLFPAWTREKVGGGGSSVPFMGKLWWKSVESEITSHVLLRLHIWFCRFGASWLWVLALQNSTTWKRSKACERLKLFCHARHAACAQATKGKRESELKHGNKCHSNVLLYFKTDIKYTPNLWHPLLEILAPLWYWDQAQL